MNPTIQPSTTPLHPAATQPATALRDFYHLGALPTQTVQLLVQRAAELRAGAAPHQFPGRALGLLFLNPSLRTSASFQRAAARLQLELVQLSGDGVWGLETATGTVMDGAAAEHVREAAAVLGRYVDVLAVRAFPAGKSLNDDLRDPLMNAFRNHAGVPLINMESARWHPCQALADWSTLEQHQIPTRGRLVLSWAWHPKALPHAVPNSTLCMAAQRGMDVTVLHPPGYALHPSVMAEAAQLAQASGGRVSSSEDRERALAGTEVVYAKSWGSLDCWGDAAAESAQRAHLRDWCVQPDWLQGSARFMHCLPLRRNVVAADAVLDGPASLLLDQAENRLHAQTALLEEILS